MQAIYKPRKRVPSQRGNATAVILLLVLIAAFGLAAMGADVAHLVSVKAQLQNASDAGALAGAQNLLKINPTSQDQTNANNDAVATTASNVADATSVSNQTANTNVSVAVNAAAQPYTVTVQATRQAPSLFAGIFGASSEPVYTKSVAEASLGLKSLGPNQAINVAVSLNWAPPKGIQAGKALDSYAGLPLGQPFLGIAGVGGVAAR